MKAATNTELRWLRLSLVVVWLWTAVASVWEWHGQSHALLAALPNTWPWPWLKPTLIGGGAALDALLGLWLWWRPGRAAYGAALAAMLFMTTLATAIEPAWWLHPLGPLSKNIPMAAALVLLWRRDPRA